MKQSKGTIPESLRVELLDRNLGIESIVPKSQLPKYAVFATSPGPSPKVVGGELKANGNFGGSKVYLGRWGFMRHGGRVMIGDWKATNNLIETLETSPMCKGFTVLEVPKCPLN